MDVEKLEKLHELKEKGILSAEEFEIQKKILMRENSNKVIYSAYPQSNNKSLILLICFLILLSVLFVGYVLVAVPYFNNKKMEEQVTQEVESVKMIIANIRTLYSSQGNYSGLNNNTAKMLGIVPKQMYESEDSNIIKNSYGNKVEITSLGCGGYGYGYNYYRYEDNCFKIISEGISQQACSKIIEQIGAYADVSITNADSCSNCGNSGCNIKIVVL